MNDLIQQRLDAYKCRSVNDEQNAIKEITQEIVLHSLFEAGFFEAVAFQGGTALRILHGLRRFSEDLDFALMRASTTFDLASYMAEVSRSMAAYGYALRITGKDNVDSAVKHRFLKEDSIGSIVTFDHVRTFRGAIAIKVEVDTNPPKGGHYEVKYVDFPIDFPVMAFDLPSLFAGKSHALLCRSFLKGRDWFDFGWYVARSINPNFNLLSEALNQVGPWQGQGINVTAPWYLETMRQRIQDVDWASAKADVERFIKPEDLKTLDHWSLALFKSKLEKMAHYMRA